MARADIGDGIELEWDEFGDPADPTLLLVMGLGSQMIVWDAEFCRRLVARGFHVVRFDNRDVGLSTRLDHLGVPDPLQVIAGAVPPAYTIEDMADDAAALLDELGLDAVHACGASMGGYIAQTLAINHPDRVLSLTSIMSGPGGRDATPPTPEATAVLLTPPPQGREELIEHGVWITRVLSAGHFDEARARRRRTEAVDRAVSPDGTARQFGAVIAQSSRVEDLARIDVPVLVIHGDADPLVPYAEGLKTHRAVPHSRLLTIAGMGHDIPPDFYDEIADAIAQNAGLLEPAS